jgi:4-diphosphocytidyl-2-C-methyl-D-erythritol kinase
MVALAVRVRNHRQSRFEQTTMPKSVRQLTRRAPAKLNLFLEVLSRRADGYHEIASLMVPLDWHDELEFSSARDLTLSCDEPALDVGPTNLVMQAARTLQATTGCQAGAAIHLRKRLPWAAGLGGGSSDAAATLLGLNQLWKLELKPAELQSIATKLGSDVGFFLNGGPAWCTGRGEIVAPVTLQMDVPVLVIVPGFGLRTPDVYRRLEVPARPLDVLQARQRLESASTLMDLGAALFNRLQEPALAIRPELAEIPAMLAATARPGEILGQQLSGSGSAWFALCSSFDAAQRLAALLPTRIHLWPRLAQAGLRFVPARWERVGLPRRDA